VYGSHSPCINVEVKGQGHSVIECAAGVGMQVDVTA